MAKFEVFGRWAELSDSTGGISVTSDVKSGWDIHDGIIRLSLLKAPMQTDMWADYGQRKFTVRILMNEPLYKTIELSDELNNPVPNTKYIQPKTPINISNSIPMSSEFVSTSDPYIIVETLKLSENGKGFIARVYEAGGGWRKGVIEFLLLDSKKWKVSAVSLLENSINEDQNKRIQKINSVDLKVELQLHPFEVVTILFEKI